MGNKRKNSSPPKNLNNTKVAKESTSPQHSPPQTRAMSKLLETWLKAIQADIKKLTDENFELKKDIAVMKCQATLRDERLALLEEGLQNTTRLDHLKKIDDESQTLMFSGFTLPNHHPNEREAAFKNYVGTNLPPLGRDLNILQPEITFNSPDARHPTAFLRFPTRKGAFETAKNFSKTRRNGHSLRSCIPKEIKVQKDALLKELKEDPVNNGWFIQITLGHGRERDKLVCKRAKDPGNTSRPLDWSHIRTIPTLKTPAPPVLKTPQDPILWTPDCWDLDPAVKTK